MLSSDTIKYILCLLIIYAIYRCYYDNAVETFVDSVPCQNDMPWGIDTYESDNQPTGVHDALVDNYDSDMQPFNCREYCGLGQGEDEEEM